MVHLIRPSRAIERLSHSERANKRGGPTADVVSLATGDPSFDTPGPIREAAITAIRDGRTHYPPANGEADLRQAIAAALSEKGSGSYAPSDVIVTSGASAGIYASMLAYLDPGDEVLLHDPVYSLYADVALSIGAVPVRVGWAKHFRLDAEALERAATPRSRMLILNNPTNPTGTVFNPGEMRTIVDFVRAHDLLLLADEAYDHIVYDGQPMISASSFPELAERLITINTCSKTFAMTGWRIGYVAAHGGLIAPIAVAHRTATGFVNSVGQRAALTAFTTKNTWQGWMLDEYARRRAHMCQRVNAMPGLHCERPDGAFYVFVTVDGKLTSREMVQHCLRHGVAVRSGTEFGPRGEGFIRLTFAVPESCFERGLARLETAMRAL